MHFTVSIDPPQELEASVSFATGGPDDTAAAGEDYSAVAGVLTLPPFFSSGEVVVEVLGDDAFEEDETFSFRLFDPSNASLPGPDNTATATVTITNDDDDSCADLTLSVSPSESFPVEGGTGQVVVTAGPECEWSTTVIFPDSGPTGWLTLGAGSSGIGNGSFDFMVEANDDIDLRTATIEVYNSTHQVSQDGTLCQFTVDPGSVILEASGGSGLITVDASLEVCSWTAVSPMGWLVFDESPDCPAGTDESCEHGGTGDGTVSFSIGPNMDPPRDVIATVAGMPVSFEQDGIFLAEFDDDLLDGGWSFSGDWSEQQDRLEAQVEGFGNVAQAIARPAFAGCVQCMIETSLRFDVFSTGTLTLFGWYLNADQHVALVVDEFANRLTLTQRFAGEDVLQLVDDSHALVPEQDYAVRMGFDGANLWVEIDDILIFNTPPAVGTVLDGTVGLGAEATAGSFAFLSALTETRGNLPGTVDILRPVNGADFPSSSGLLSAAASDPEDGDLSAAIFWSSDVDGDLGSGSELTVELSEGVHTLRAEVLDSGLLPAFDTVTVTVVGGLVFADGFESGDLSQWSFSSP